MNNPENSVFLTFIFFILFFTDFWQPIWMILLVSFTVALLCNLYPSFNEDEHASSQEQ
ncbi:MAG: hypothetical protein AB8G95_16375 [Anaerolineae bacterium]